MKKLISFTASLEIDCDDNYNPMTFKDAESSDFDNIGRPIDRLEDLGWKISNKRIKEI